jgi:hypothetical protein
MSVEQGMHYLVRPESIIMGFLKGFFQQEKLYKEIANEFRYVDNQKQKSLIIKMSENYGEDAINTVPAIYVQEMGATESIEGMGPNMNWSDIFLDKYATQGTFYHPFTLHCISGTKESAKLLQSTTSQAIIVFRKAIYELGLDNISPLQCHAPQRLEGPEHLGTNIMYDCAISFQVKAAQQWLTSRKEYGDVQPEEEIYIKTVFALNEIEYEEGTCTPLGDPSEWFSQQVT